MYPVNLRPVMADAYLTHICVCHPLKRYARSMGTAPACGRLPAAHLINPWHRVVLVCMVDEVCISVAVTTANQIEDFGACVDRQKGCV